MRRYGQRFTTQEMASASHVVIAKNIAKDRHRMSRRVYTGAADVYFQLVWECQKYIATVAFSCLGRCL